MGLKEKSIKINQLYGFSGQRGVKWYVLQRYIGTGISSTKVTIAYALENGVVTERVKGKLNKKSCNETTLSIIGEDGEEKFVGMNQLHRASFEIANAYNGDIDIFVQEVIDGRTVVYIFYSDKILGRKVFPQEYPVFYAYKFGEDDRISEFTAGIITDVKNEEEQQLDGSHKVIRNVEVSGWRIDEDSCDEASADLIGNMAVANDFDFKLNFGSGVRKFGKVFNLNQSIIDFNSNPYGYFSGANGTRKHKSIFDKDGK